MTSNVRQPCTPEDAGKTVTLRVGKKGQIRSHIFATATDCAVISHSQLPSSGCSHLVCAEVGYSCSGQC